MFVLLQQDGVREIHSMKFAKTEASLGGENASNSDRNSFGF